MCQTSSTTTSNLFEPKLSMSKSLATVGWSKSSPNNAIARNEHRVHVASCRCLHVRSPRRRSCDTQQAQSSSCCRATQDGQARRQVSRRHPSCHAAVAFDSFRGATDTTIPSSQWWCRLAADCKRITSMAPSRRHSIVASPPSSPSAKEGFIISRRSKKAHSVEAATKTYKQSGNTV